MVATKVTFGRKRVGTNAEDPEKSASSGRDLKKASSSTKVKFGTVVVHVRSLDKTQVLSNVEYSTKALERSKSKLMKSGVTIRKRKDVPLYYMDESDSGKFIRKLNGRVERGVLENGVFKVTA